MIIDIDKLSEDELRELNHKIIERLRMVHQIKMHKEMFKFKIGDRVSFQPPGRELLRGTLSKFNKKTVTVITDDGGHWNVAPFYISLAEKKANSESHIKLLASKN